MTEAFIPSAGSLAERVRRIRERLGGWLIRTGQRIATGTADTSAPLQQGIATLSDRDRRQLEDRRQGGDRFASLASMIPGVVYQRVVTPAGEITYTYISDGARDMFGVEPLDVLDDPEALFCTYSEEYKANFRQKLITASQSMQTWDVEASIIGPDGNIRYTHAIAKPEKLPDGSVLWTGLILDATRIKLVEEELKAANRSVEAANRAKSLFLANMSHEIRTPMNGVLGMSDLLFKTNLNGRQTRLLSTLRHSAKTLLGIINDVLDISRIEAGRFELENEPFELRTCLEEALDLCSSAAFAKGLEVALIVQGAIPERVIGDVGRLRQVLINLIGNAVKFTETGSAIVRVSATEQNGKTRVIIGVIDTGVGIAADAKESLFAPFAQADSSISRKFGGTGLGLAITRHLVTLMGGSVDLQSQLGRGTTVTVEIPFEVDASDIGFEIERDDLKDCRVLIADNRGIVRDAMASCIDGGGAVIDRATDELETISLLQWAAECGRPYTHVIIDRLRPGSDSAEFCASIIADPNLSDTQVIRVVSMTSREAFGADNISQGAIILSKPVRRLDLLAALSLEPESKAQVHFIGDADGFDDVNVEDSVDATSPVTQAFSGLRVLVAEDNPVNQELVLEYLSAFGCDVVLTSNGAEAVAEFAPGRFDVVLMDCQMPVMDGLTAVRAIRKAEAEAGADPVPVIAVTANAYESDRTEAHQAGMDDYLIKPFSEDCLHDLLQKWRDRSADSQAA